MTAFRFKLWGNTSKCYVLKNTGIFPGHSYLQKMCYRNLPQVSHSTAFPPAWCRIVIAANAVKGLYSKWLEMSLLEHQVNKRLFFFPIIVWPCVSCSTLCFHYHQFILILFLDCKTFQWIVSLGSCVCTGPGTKPPRTTTTYKLYIKHY